MSIIDSLDTLNSFVNGVAEHTPEEVAEAAKILTPEAVEYLREAGYSI